MKRIYWLLVGITLIGFAGCSQAPEVEPQAQAELPRSTFPAVLTPTLEMAEPSPTTGLTAAPILTQAPTLDWSQLALPDSMKGYEFYSWQQAGQWYFTLITGTNRMKSFDEITSDENEVTPDGWVKITVNSAQQAGLLLARLPAGSEVFWAGMEWPDSSTPTSAPFLTYPPEAVRQELKAAADAAGIKLNIAVP